MGDFAYAGDVAALFGLDGAYWPWHFRICNPQALAVCLHELWTCVAARLVAPIHASCFDSILLWWLNSFPSAGAGLIQWPPGTSHGAAQQGAHRAECGAARAALGRAGRQQGRRRRRGRRTGRGRGRGGRSLRLLACRWCVGAQLLGAHAHPCLLLLLRVMQPWAAAHWSETLPLA